MTTLLELLKKDTVLDLDCNDDAVATKYGPFGNMTSNQAIVLFEVAKPQNTELVKESAHQARRDIDDGLEKDVSPEALAVDWMAVKLAVKVLPHLDPQGYVLTQTSPSLARDTDRTVEHARRIVRVYGRAGVPQSRIAIKIPSTLEGLRACRILEKDYNIRALATVLFCAEQAIAAAEEANCVYCSPYANPLYVHFVPGKHVAYGNPVNEMPGMRMTALVQREFKKRGVRTKVLAASLVTMEEVIALSGVDRVTIMPGMLDKLAETIDTPDTATLREMAKASYETSFEEGESFPSDAHFPLDEPAEALKAALARPEVDSLIQDALFHFGNAETKLLGLAKEALSK